MDYFVYFIIVVKILFVVCAVIERLFASRMKRESLVWIVYWKERLELVFILSMSILCMRLFNPFTQRGINGVVVDKTTQLLLFVYGIIIMITADWNVLADEPRWFKSLKSIV